MYIIDMHRWKSVEISRPKQLVHDRISTASIIYDSAEAYNYLPNRWHFDYFFSRLFLTFFIIFFFRPPPAKDQFQSPSVSYFCTVRLSNSSYSYLGIKYPFYFCGYFCHHDVFSLMLFHHTFPVMLPVLFTCLLCTDTRGGIIHIALTSTKDLFVFWDTETLNWLWNRGSPKEHTTAKPITNMVRLRTQTLV